MSVSSYPFHSLLLKLPNNEMCFPFPPLKLPNKGIEEYSKMIHFISFYSIPFSPPKRGLSQLRVTKVNIFTNFGKENSKITSHRLNERIRKRKGQKSSFLFVHFVHLNGHPIAGLTLKIDRKSVV